MAECLRSFEMSISRNDFLRLLPRATDGSTVEAAENVFVHAEVGRHWRIALQPLPELALGVLRLERHRIEWCFSDYSEVEIAAILDRFERHFRRGGG